MKILLCYATAGEGKIIKEKIKNLNLKIHLNITYLCTGMGNYNVIFNLTKVLNSQIFDMVLNIGVCGYMDESKPRIQVARTVNLTTNKELIVPIFVEFGSLESIGCSEVPVIIKTCNSDPSDESEHSEESRLINNSYLDPSFHSGGLKRINYFDMESRGIEYVCDKFRVPRVILKVPVDKIGEEEFDREKASELLAENLDYGEIIKRLTDQ